MTTHTTQDTQAIMDELDKDVKKMEDARIRLEQNTEAILTSIEAEDEIDGGSANDDEQTNSEIEEEKAAFDENLNNAVVDLATKQ